MTDQLRERIINELTIARHGITIDSTETYGDIADNILRLINESKQSGRGDSKHVLPPKEILYCPHCGTDSGKSTIKCQTQYTEMSILTCYNCGKEHIRNVSNELLKLVRAHSNAENKRNELLDKSIDKIRSQLNDRDRNWKGMQKSIKILQSLRSKDGDQK